MDRMKVGVGAFLLAISSLLILMSGEISTPIPLAVLAVAALGLSAGTLLVGTSGSEGRPV